MKSKTNLAFACLSLVLLFCLILLSTPLRDPLPFYLSTITLCLTGAGFIFGVGRSLVRIFYRTVSLRQTLISCAFLIWMALGFFFAVLQGMFAPTWVRSETVQGETYDVMDESFLDPACRVTRRRYVFWTEAITSLENHCDPQAVTFKETPRGVEVWSGKRLLGKYPAP